MTTQVWKLLPKSYISNDITDFTDDLKESITKQLEDSEDEQQKLISLNEALINANTSRLQSDESWLATLMNPVKNRANCACIKKVLLSTDLPVVSVRSRLLTILRKY